MRGICSMIFRYAVASGIAERDPSADLLGALTPPPKRHFASITDPQGEDLPPREAFHAMFGRYIRTALEHREEFLFVEQYHLSPVISEEGRIGTDFRLGQRSLTELTRDGVLRDLDPLILDAVVLGTANQLLCLHFAGHLALDDAVIRAAMDACWHAIAAAPRLTE